MMTEKTLVDKFTSTPEGMRLFRQEATMLQATEIAEGLMEKHGINREQLAKRLGWPKKRLNRWLDGEGDRMRTFSDILTALGYGLHMRTIPIKPEA